jgi:UDP-N-acetylglucosamine 2-epimerase
MFPEDFLRLLVHSTAIVGNSSVAIRECSFLGVPAVNVGTRQQGRERGANVIDVEHDRGAIADAMREHARRGRPKADHLYGNGDAGRRIADCLAKAELTIEKRLTY